MPRHKWKFKMYRDLASEASSILDELRDAAKDLGIAPMPAQNVESRPGGKGSFDRMRELVKARYSDAYDCCVAETPTSGLWIACQAAFGESRFRRGSLPRCVAPRQKELSIAVSTLPPKYKHVYPAHHPSQAPGFDVVVVPLEGADYSNHGVSNSPVSLLAAVNPETSLEALAATAQVHGPFLAGVYSQGESTPGSGFGPLDAEGVLRLYSGMSELAAEFDVPYVIDERHGVPLIGEVAAEGTSLTVYGHRALGGPCVIVGTEDLIAPLLKAGPPVPAETDMAKLARLLTGFVDDRDRYLKDLSRLYEEVARALGALDSGLKSAIRVRKSPASLAVEINYEDTWHDATGFPIFTAEDSQSGMNILEAGISAMGIESATVMEASIMLHLPDPVGDRVELDEDRAALEMKALVRLLEILGRRSGYLD